MTIIILSLIFLSAVAKAVVDAIFHGFSSSVFASFNPEWWDPKKSWRNKYKPHNKIVRYLTTTILVTFTDAWHTFEFIRNKSLILAVVLGMAFGSEVFDWWAMFLIGAVFHQTVFHFSYNIFRNL